MGQYYDAILRFNNGIYMKIDPRGGAKLTEHSYVNNSFALRVCDLIRTNGKTHLAWVGDYAEIDDSDDKLTKEMIKRTIENKNFNLVEEFHMGFSEFVKNNIIKISDIVKKHEYTIINLKTNEFINMKDYVEYNQDKEDIFHPLPLLTAIGNGRGGGDYSGENERLIGSWAGNEFYIIDNSKLNVIKNIDEDELFTLEFYSEYHQDVLQLINFKNISTKINFVES